MNSCTCVIKICTTLIYNTTVDNINAKVLHSHYLKSGHVNLCQAYLFTRSYVFSQSALEVMCLSITIGQFLTFTVDLISFIIGV